MSSLKLESKNNNYAATVIKVNTLTKLDKLDNLLGLPIFGFQAIVSKSVTEGTLGIVFTAESQLSEDFAKVNNLYRHKELNQNKEITGYLDDTRRVKAIKLKGNVSSALFMPLSSLSYLGINVNDLKEGDTFDSINGIEVCRKYKIKRQQSEGGPKNKQQGKNKKFDRVITGSFPEHLDTDNYFKNSHKIKPEAYVTGTQKLHGTSGRFAHIKVLRKLKWFERVLLKLGLKIDELEYATIAGSRRVVKDVQTDRQYNHYYQADIWNTWLERIKHLIPKDYIIYGEIIGWIGETPIQQGYTYNLPQGESELYIYRITHINADNVQTDLGWEQVKHFCRTNGLKYVPELFQEQHAGLNVQYYMDVFLDELDNGRQVVSLKSPESGPADEGIVIRLEGLTPYILKAKSPLFLAYESGQLDKGVADVESQQSDDSGDDLV